jgi:hypothetical protein
LRLNLSISNLCDPCLLTVSLSLIFPLPYSGQYHNLLPCIIKHQVHSNVFGYLPEYGQSDCGFFPSGDVQVGLYPWMLRCRNIVLLTLRFLDVAKFTKLTPLSLWISSKLSIPIVSLKIS